MFLQVEKKIYFIPHCFVIEVLLFSLQSVSKFL